MKMIIAVLKNITINVLSIEEYNYPDLVWDFSNLDRKARMVFKKVLMKVIVNESTYTKPLVK